MDSRSSSRSSSRVSSDPAPTDVKPAVPNVAPDVGDLVSRLADAERNLKVEAPEPSEGTLDSEERDMCLLAQQIEDELERKWTTGSVSTSDGDKDEKRFKRRTRGNGIRRPQGTPFQVG